MYIYIAYVFGMYVRTYIPRHDANTVDKVLTENIASIFAKYYVPLMSLKMWTPHVPGEYFSAVRSGVD